MVGVDNQCEFSVRIVFPFFTTQLPYKDGSRAVRRFLCYLPK